MGAGRWDTDVHKGMASERSARGEPDFGYHAETTSRPKEEWSAHPGLSPRWENNEGQRIRECRESDEHPGARPIAVLFDVTGSMGGIPVTLQKKLPALLGLLLRNGYVGEHPQVLFGAIGDATCDRVPLQIGQFESDIRMDENLRSFILESGGGSGDRESYELAMYFMARHTVLDSVETRGDKGYLFIIGDEQAYSAVNRREVSAVIGDELQEDIPVADIADELKRKFEVAYILPRGAQHGGEKKILNFWYSLFGQNVLELQDPDAVCETIAMFIAVREGIDLAEAAGHLGDIGADPLLIERTTQALALVGADAGSVARSGGDSLGLDDR